MFAINHAATALPLKRAFPGVPLIPLLISVQLLEVVWVALNYAGVEITTTEPVVTSVVDVHLAYMPFSHSIASAVVIALVVALATWRWWGPKAMGLALAAGILSHLVLDLVTHSPDIALAPLREWARSRTRSVDDSRRRPRDGVGLGGVLLACLRRQLGTPRSDRSLQRCQHTFPLPSDLWTRGCPRRAPRPGSDLRARADPHHLVCCVVAGPWACVPA